MFKLGIVSPVSNGLLTNLVSYYKFDTNGSFPDSHGSNTGTINGATFNATGKMVSDYTFDGTNDNISLGTLGQTNTNFTINCWIKTSDKTAVRKVFQTSNTGSGFYINTDGKIYFFRYYNGTSFNQIATGVDISNGVYRMITGVYNGTNLELYLDGVSQGTIAVTLTTFNVSAHNTFIGMAGATGQYWNGQIDELGYWNTNKTATQVSALYNGGAGLSYNSFTN